MNKERLLKLAEHLESGKLMHEEFYFGAWNANKVIDPISGKVEYVDVKDAECGTAGCAIGECPAVFPEQWKFIRFLTTAVPMLVVLDDPDDQLPLCAEESGRLFFGLSKFEFCHLFIAGDQCPYIYGGEHLGLKATRYEVAANIRAFVAAIEEQEVAHV